jgi:hypothetical protein
VKYSRCDGGGEFLNDILKTMLKAKRILMQVTVANSPQTNGLAERMNQTVVGKIRNALSNSGFPSTLWAEIASCVVYTNNRLPISSKDNRILIRILFGVTPSLSRLVSIGTFVIPKQLQTNKLAMRGKETYMVGYSTEKFGLRPWDHRKNKVVVSCDYKVYENSTYKKNHCQKSLVEEAKGRAHEYQNKTDQIAFMSETLGS